jgi:hypothetical protein
LRVGARAAAAAIVVVIVVVVIVIVIIIIIVITAIVFAIVFIVAGDGAAVVVFIIVILGVGVGVHGTVEDFDIRHFIIRRHGHNNMRGTDIDDMRETPDTVFQILEPDGRLAFFEQAC